MSARKIVIGSLIIAALYWIIDSIVDFLFFGNYGVLNVALFSPSAYEVYIRLLGAAFIFIPGLLVARMFNERKRAEEALHLEHQRAETYLESAGVIMAMVGPDELITMVNDKTCQVLGYSREQLLECNWFELLVPEIERAHRRELFHRIISGEINMDERINTLVHSDGNMLLASFHNKTLIDGSGRVLGRLMAGEVITNSRLDNEALVRAEINFRNSVKDAPLPILINRDGDVQFANNAMLQLFGYERLEDFNLNSVEKRYTPESIALLEDWWDRKQEGQNVFEEYIQREIIRTDGEVRQVEVHNTPVLWGRAEALETIYIDVTDKKMAVEALEQSEQNFRNSMDESPLAIIINDELGSNDYANKAAVELFGFANFEEMKNADMRKCHTPENLKRIMERWEKVHKGNFEPERLEHDIIRTDGELRRVESFYKLIPWDGQDCLQVTLHDITERKRAEQALVENEKRLQLISDASADTVTFIDLDYHIQYVSKVEEGISREDLIGVPLYVLANEDEIQNVKNHFDAAVKFRKTVRFETEYKRSDGTVVYYESVASPMEDAGEIIGLVVASRDISERKIIIEQLRHSQVLVSLGEMTAGIAHEIGNPLGSIVLYSEVASQDNDVPDRLKKDLNVINAEARRAGEMIKDLLAYGRKLEPKMGVVDLNEIIQKVAEIRRYQQVVRNIEMTMECKDDIPSINGDSAQLTQVFVNLILNAEDAVSESEQKRIRITSDFDGESVRVAVSDTGHGIADIHKEQIFLPFFTTKGVGKGTGLGLSTCYGIVSAHDGTITARNNKNGGATFEIVFPAAVSNRQ